jgi:hypothetical protein
LVGLERALVEHEPAARGREFEFRFVPSGRLRGNLDGALERVRGDAGRVNLLVRRDERVEIEREPERMR